MVIVTGTRAATRNRAAAVAGGDIGVSADIEVNSGAGPSVRTRVRAGARRGAADPARDLSALVRAALELGAERVAGLSADERELAAAAAASSPGPGLPLDAIRAGIAAGADPLGDALSATRTAADRRRLGQTLTPAPVVASMIGWAARQAGGAGPEQVVDPGTGSARFLLAAGRRWPRARLIGIETDPLAALVARANLAAAGLAPRATVILGDYRSARIPPAVGRTVYLGNPPYVRHHQIPAGWKRWLAQAARERGLRASGLAGLHVHFFLATARHAVPGDLGVFITAAEWLDVNYGCLVRSLLLGELGGQSVHLLEPGTQVFPDATVTSAISCFRPGSKPGPMRLRLTATPAELGELGGGRPISRAALSASGRWGPLLRGAAPARRPGRAPAGHVELGEICRVHRGQVTGANQVWVRESGQADVPPRFRFPAVTRARELFGAAGVPPEAASLKVVIDLPAELDELPGPERALVSAFIARAARAGAADSYVARHRRPWWRVGLTAPAPIIASYMARRPPAFVRNVAGVRHLNIAHGLYPRELLTGAVLDRLAAYLRSSVALGQGRTYAGGLTKFEPGEMERLTVPWERIADAIRSSC
jgi:adenine-specific DNA-methyltransferase